MNSVTDLQNFEPTQITSTLYLGSILDIKSSKHEALIKQFGLIVNVAGEARDATYDKKIEKYNIPLIHQPLGYYQGDGLEDFLFNLVRQIDEKKRKDGIVFFHCMRGRSRSAAALIGYLMIKEKISLYDAFVKVKEKRPLIGPSGGLICALMRFEKKTSTSLTLTREKFYQISDTFESALGDDQLKA
eukprot:CAMPEP_0201548182 /NCGR_PEP_ID=MMETSP0173_2-20130828/4713_1 /ASSEMBLY_ACC=CAM_ASM_000268 /TAXON_ID=218659 /ORGANISM="Vexillifera sp., Strain DIVA3 564/2" /LENGTH=186 /DNA_ID=CAMNT_0047957477 /DNA_START=725 /DNA_END=1281 /DNA_ORIENTATION=+